MSLADLSVAELQVGFREGTFAPPDVFDACRERIEECEPVINALWIQDDGARAAAESSAVRWREGRPRSPLDGVPVTIKENLARAGWPMPAGHAAGTPRVPSENSPLVDRLEESGAVILGSTVMPDWGMLSSGVSSRHGITRSPLNPALTTGGSSSGAGAAAAAGYGPVHFGTDIGGSIRLPGTWLGLATLKPSYGRVPLAEPYLGRCAGPLARRVDDLVQALRVVSRPDDRDYSRLPEGPLSVGALDAASLTIAVHTEAGAGLATDPEVAAVTNRVAATLQEAGATIRRIRPFMTEALLGHIDRFLRVRSWVDYSALSLDDQRRIVPFVADWARGGADLSAAQALESFAAIGEVRALAVRESTRADFVLSPVAPVAAFPAEDPMPYEDASRPMAHIAYTVPYNVSEQPAVTVLGGYTSDGRTVGVQVAGRRFDDAGVLGLAAWLERHLGVEPPRRAVGI